MNEKIPCLFDGKDIILDEELYSWFFREQIVNKIKYAHTSDFKEFIFVFHEQRCCGTISENKITIENSLTPIDDVLIDILFCGWNKYEDSNIYCEKKLISEHTIEISYYKKEQ